MQAAIDSRLNYSMLLVMSGCGTPARDVRFQGAKRTSNAQIEFFRF